MLIRFLFPTLLLATCLLPESGAEEKGEKHVVLIGVEDYQDPKIPDLDYCVEDVWGLETVFKDPEICLYDRRNVIALHTEQKNPVDRPTLSNIRAELRRVLSRARKDDLVVVYFSGHGMVSPKGEGYLIPMDCKVDQVLQTALPVAELVRMFKDCPAERRMLILDCCHSGAGGKRLIAEKAQPGAEVLAKQFNEELPQVVTLASCKKEEVSYEWTEKKHGYFTWFLLEALQSGFADSDESGILTTTELAGYLEGTVRGRVKKDRSGSQTPLLVVSKPGVVPSIPLGRASFKPFVLDLENQQNGLPPKGSEGKLIVKDGKLVPDLAGARNGGRDQNYALELPKLGVRKSFVLSVTCDLWPSGGNGIGIDLRPKEGKPYGMGVNSRGGLGVNGRPIVPKFAYLNRGSNHIELTRIVSERGSTLEMRVNGHLFDVSRIDAAPIPEIVLSVYYCGRNDPAITSFEVKPYQPEK